MNATDCLRQIINSNKDNAYLESSKADKGTYSVSLSFVVDEYGKVGKIVVTSTPGYNIEDQAVEFVKQTSGKWDPAIDDEGNPYPQTVNKTITWYYY